MFSLFDWQTKEEFQFLVIVAGVLYFQVHALEVDPINLFQNLLILLHECTRTTLPIEIIRLGCERCVIDLCLLWPKLVLSKR